MEFVEVLQQLVDRRDLSRQQAIEVMEMLMAGQVSEAQTAAMLIALRMKGETVEELTGFALVMRRRASPVCPQPAAAGQWLVDTCGTGGDASGTFNISTAAAFVAAGAGARIAKHGNRSVSSRCGSADVLEALGVRIDLTPDRIAQCIDRVGIGFLFAPQLHEAMKHVMPARRQLRIRTVFNLLGPLTNPACAQAHVLGVYSRSLVETIAEVLKNLGVRRAMVVCGEDGLDEISLTAPTDVAEVRDGHVDTYRLRPEQFGLKRVEMGDLKGGDPAANAQMIRAILAGDQGARADIVRFNAAAALYMAGRAADLAEGLELARGSISGGNALEALEALIRLTQEV